MEDLQAIKMTKNHQPKKRGNGGVTPYLTIILLTSWSSIYIDIIHPDPIKTMFYLTKYIHDRFALNGPWSCGELTLSIVVMGIEVVNVQYVQEFNARLCYIIHAGHTCHVLSEHWVNPQQFQSGTLLLGAIYLPSEKYESPLGSLFPTEWKHKAVKHVPVTTNQFFN